MGCSTSKLDDEEVVQLCKDRKRFIKQTVEQRTRFASGHIAYIQSLKGVCSALRDYIEGYEPCEFLLDSFIKPPFTTPIKKTSLGSNNSNFIRSGPHSTMKINYLRSGGNGAVLVEERPPSPETVRFETYSPMHQYDGADRFFGMQSSSPVNSSSFFSYSPNYNNRPSTIPLPSPQASHWDFFWNPFSSLDYYGYPTRSSGLDQTAMDDDIRGLRQVREEEGIPELEEDETLQEEMNHRENVMEERSKLNRNFVREEVLVEDVDEDEDEDDDEEDEDNETESACEEAKEEEEEEVKNLQSTRPPRRSGGRVEVSRVQNVGPLASTSNREKAVVGQEEAKEETQGFFTAYANRKPTSMEEVIKDLETQFMVVCNSASEVSALLEASRAPFLSSSNEITAVKMLNPVALLRSASSSCSASSRYLVSTSSNSKDESCECTSGDMSEESCMVSGSHQSTLDRLYAWEKKLYEEVRCGEKVRIAYEKKCNQLRNQDVKSDDPSLVEKTRAAIRDLHTQMKVSIHSVEAISKRIETLRDEELQPQLLELIQGLARMWKVMAECHQSQKRTLDEAKFLLAGIPSKLESRQQSIIQPQRLARLAANLETQLRNWRSCFKSWIASQRSYLRALTGWLQRCLRSDPDSSKLPLSPHRSSGSLPIFGLCIQWLRFLDAINETPVLEGIDFFAAGMGSLYAQQQQQQREESRRGLGGLKRFEFPEDSGNDMEIVEVGGTEEEEVVMMSAEKMAEVAVRVLCAGMSVAMSSLTEFAISSADGYSELIKQWENATCQRSSTGAGM